MLSQSDLEVLVDGDIPGHSVAVYLGREDVAKYLGLKDRYSLVGVQLPPHDAEIGNRKGWLPETIDRWNASRPGRGWWGARMARRERGRFCRA